MNILVAYRGIPQSPGWATGDSMVRAFRALGHQAYPYGRYYKTGEPLGKMPKDVDLLLYMEHNDDDPPYLELCNLNCIKAYWEFDTAMHRNQTAIFLNHMRFNHVFLANHKLLQMVGGATYLPYAADPELFPLGRSVKRGAGIVGSSFPQRVEFAEKAHIRIISGKFREEYVKEIQNLAIHVHHFASGGDGMLVMRIFETMATGTMLLTEADPTLDLHFQDKKHLATYRSPEECRALVKRYLEKKRNQMIRIATTGHQEVIAKHTYKNRAQTILETLGLH